MAQPSDPARIEALAQWLVDGAPPLSDGRSIVRAFCEKLNEANVPVDLFRLFIFTIHPTIKGRRLQWTQATGTKINEADFKLFETVEYYDNPLPQVIKARKSLRRRLIDPDCPHDFRVVGELIAAGYTDYLIQPVVYMDGEVHTMSWTTRHPGGFSPEAIAALEKLNAPIARLAESYILRLNAENIISTYVGREAGAKVLKGQIKRGDFESIEAVILFADLKGFTQFSGERPVSEVLDRLNRFFDALEGPIARNGGEILKFMGDGILAIFPVRAAHGTGETAMLALAAVSDARKALQNETFGFRSALHFGQLAYGNIGASRRLDFTAIGPAVNLTARLLGAASGIECDDVVSAAFAGLVKTPCKLVARLHLKGIDGETDVYAPPSLSAKA